MIRPMIIGITGGIGSGKTTICKVFEALRVSIYFSDIRAKELMHEDLELKKALIKSFGDDVFDGSRLNTKLLAEKVFNNAEKLGKLNGLVHPVVKEDFKNWVKKHSQEKYVIKESALLFETGGQKDLDKTILVSAPLQLRITRVLSRDSHRTEADIKAIISKQIDQTEARKMADFIIKNDEKALLIPQILKLHQQFINQ